MSHIVSEVAELLSGLETGNDEKKRQALLVLVSRLLIDSRRAVNALERIATALEDVPSHEEMH